MDNKGSQRHRHILATIWLGIILIGNGVAAPIYIIGHPELKKALPQAPDIIWPIFGFLGIVAAICCIALFRWKKWGFWGICTVSALSIVPYLLYGAGHSTLIGPCAVLLLFDLLRVGKDNSAWQQLE